MTIVSLSSIRAAASRLAPYVHRTPVITSSALDALAGRRLFLKCESFQRTGSFKIRGALNAVLSLSEADAARGVITDSSGNFGQALALAAQLRGIPVTIVMPSHSAAVKQDAVRGYGARVVLCGTTLSERAETASRLRQETGSTYVSSSNHPDVISGQGTVALELLEQVRDLDTIIVPVGGGGLASGVALVATVADPTIRVIGAQPEGADDAARSLAAGRRIPPDRPSTVAKGLFIGLGELTWPLIRDHVERIVTVSDPEILRAMRLLLERAKIVVEPSGAVPFAVALSERLREEVGGERVGVVLSGGNVGADDLGRLLSPSAG